MKVVKNKYVQLYRADCLKALKLLPDNSVDSVVTDPPYGLGKEPNAVSMLQDWVKQGHHDVKATGGFMGKAWDSFVPQPLMWKEVFRVLKPGGHVLCFSGTRTYDLMTLGLRLAGFEIRDCLMWVYSTGFPKSVDVSKAVEEADNEELEGWGTALKPAVEPIVLARKPTAGKSSTKTFQEHGTGALNIDDCRFHANKGILIEGTHNGRWPSNFMHDGSEEVRHAFHLSSDSPRLSSTPTLPNSAARFFYCGKATKEDREEGMEDFEEKLFGMSGGAAAAAARGEEYDNGDGGVNKTSLRKNIHPTVKPTQLMRYLVKLVTPPNGVVLDPFMGSGSTGKAAMLENRRFIGIEREKEYFPTCVARIKDAALKAKGQKKSKVKNALKGKSLFAKL